MKRVTFITACWKRPQILAIYEEAMHRFISQSKYECYNAYVLSPDEDDNSYKLFEIASKNFSYQCHFPNKPLGAKWNYLLEQVIEKIDSDYYVIMGSDDIHNLTAWKHYEYIIDNGLDYGGHNSLKFYDTIKGKCVKWKSNTKIAGCGTILSRKLVKECFPLWASDINKGLDASRTRRIESYGYKPHIFDSKYCITDLKSDVNIGAFDKFERKQYNRKTATYKSVKESTIELDFTEQELKMIYELKRIKKQNTHRS